MPMWIKLERGVPSVEMNEGGGNCVSILRRWDMWAPSNCGLRYRCKQRNTPDCLSCWEATALETVVVVVQLLSRVRLFETHGLQHARLPCLSRSPGLCSDSRPLSWWCHPTISSSVTGFSCCPQSFLASGSFPMSWLFVSGSQSIGASASASVLPMNIQGWFPCCLRDSQESSPAP